MDFLNHRNLNFKILNGVTDSKYACLRFKISNVNLYIALSLNFFEMIPGLLIRDVASPSTWKKQKNVLSCLPKTQAHFSTKIITQSWTVLNIHLSDASDFESHFELNLNWTELSVLNNHLSDSDFRSNFESRFKLNLSLNYVKSPIMYSVTLLVL